VRFNKQTLKRKEEWGTFVDVKINALEVLERELALCRPKRVLIGSTTECYQPCEVTYQLTRQIIERLNKEKIPVTIMTRSPLIERDCELIAENREPVIYFTVSPLPSDLQKVLEPGAPRNSAREKAIRALRARDITVHVYVTPIIPTVSDPYAVFEKFKDVVGFIDFEGLNLKMINPERVLALLKGNGYETSVLNELFSSAEAWDHYWACVGKEIRAWEKERDVRLQFFHHHFSDYFGILDYQQT
jgi:DNA repair photolyase